MKQYVVDAFTDRIFHGNQAAVCVLDKWLPDELMMSIARENNFSETAFTVKCDDGYELRWFTPGGEINLCGHATLGTAFVLFDFYEQDAQRLVFRTLSGELFVTRRADLLVMDFPAYACNEIEVTAAMSDCLGAVPGRAYLDRDLLLVFDDEDTVRNLNPDFAKMLDLPGDGVGITARGRNFDCVSRFFAPKLKVNEDPVTGSVHCMIAPYWAGVLQKNSLHAFQASARGGELFCEVKGARVEISGKAALFAEAEIRL